MGVQQGMCGGQSTMFWRSVFSFLVFEARSVVIVRLHFVLFCPA